MVGGGDMSSNLYEQFCINIDSEKLLQRFHDRFTSELQAHMSEVKPSSLTVWRANVLIDGVHCAVVVIELSFRMPAV